MGGNLRIQTSAGAVITLADNSSNTSAITWSPNSLSIINSSGGGAIFVGASAARTGSNTNRTVGQTTWCVSDTITTSSSGADLFCVDGVGIEQMVTGVTASNNLAGTSACAASGDIGKRVLYSDTSTSKITECVCEQTAAATFAWGPVTAAGDCT
jgi:hypothetical protein